MSKVPRIDSAVLAVLDGVPPLEDMGTTADQQALWHDVRRGAGIVKALLEAYFCGENPKGILNGLKPCDRRTYEAITMYYVDFYNLLFWHWEDISEATAHDSAFPKKPEEACLFLIKTEVAAMLSTGQQSYDRYSVKAHRETHKILQKIDSNRPNEIQDPTLSKQLRKLTQLDDYLKPFFKFKIDVIGICKTGKRSKQQRQALKRFHESEAEMQAAIQSRLHPRNKEQGWQWYNGVQSPIR